MSPPVTPLRPPAVPPADRDTPQHVVIVAWRDLANPRAGGSEHLVDQLASGLQARGTDVTLLCGGPTAPRPYRVVRSGGTYSQFLLAPLAYRQHIRARADVDVLVEVCNGLPYLAPLWCGRPTVCLVNHVHTDLWGLRYPPPLSTVGRFTERSVMPRVHSRSLFLTVSDSTASQLTTLGVPRDRIRLLHNGVEPPAWSAPRSPTPLFVTLGRLAEYKRLDVVLRLWERVRPVTGGRLLIVGDGPDRARLEKLAGPDVTFTGHVSDAAKQRLLAEAWLLLHPALIEGWGIVVAEAACHGTPTIGFNVPGLRDSVSHEETGVLAGTEGEFASAWASLALHGARRERMGIAARKFAENMRWSCAVDRFAEVVDEAAGR